MGEGAPREPDEEIEAKLGNPGDPVTSGDYQYFRNQWTEAGSALAKKYTEESGVEHTIADGLQPIAETYNAIYDREKEKRETKNNSESTDTYPPLKKAA